MNVRFYKTNKKINSTLIPSGEGTLVDVYLKSPSSIINPRFELNQYLDVNYCYIPQFNRYYFINEIRYENPLWVYSCNVDVLASFKTEIGNSNKYILRSASNYDLLVGDSMYVPKSTYSVQVDTIRNAIPFSDGYVVVGVVGDNSNANGITYYEITTSGYSSLLKQLLTTAYGDYEWGDISDGIINSIMNPFQYVVSAHWYPDTFEVSGQTTIKAGLWDSQVNGGIIDGTKLQSSSLTTSGRMNVRKHPKASTRGQYLNLKPYTKYYLSYGGFGTIELDNNLLLGVDTIYFDLQKDFTNGNARLRINSASSGGSTILDLKFKWGVELPIESSQSNGGTNLLGNAIGLVSSIATMNPLGIASNTVGAIASGIEVMTPSISINGSMGGYLTHTSPMQLITVFYDITDEDLINKGRPLCQMKTINTLSGYLVCEEGNINSNASEQEKESIANYLTKGFYYE